MNNAEMFLKAAKERGMSDDDIKNFVKNAASLFNSIK